MNKLPYFTRWIGPLTPDRIRGRGKHLFYLVQYSIRFKQADDLVVFVAYGSSDKQEIDRIHNSLSRRFWEF